MTSPNETTHNQLLQTLADEAATAIDDLVSAGGNRSRVSDALLALAHAVGDAVGNRGLVTRQASSVPGPVPREVAVTNQRNPHYPEDWALAGCQACGGTGQQATSGLPDDIYRGWRWCKCAIENKRTVELVEEQPVIEPNPHIGSCVQCGLLESNLAALRSEFDQANASDVALRLAESERLRGVAEGKLEGLRIVAQSAADLFSSDYHPAVADLQSALATLCPGYGILLAALEGAEEIPKAPSEESSSEGERDRAVVAGDKP